tara:strand:+ start:311 stop:598 length:288 start_codon:yes stop_codon:yes gene_type:complete
METFKKTRILKSMKRLNNNINGIPTIELMFEGNYQFRTKSGSSIVFKLSDALLNKELDIKYHVTKGGKYILDDFNIFDTKKANKEFKTILKSINV